MGGRWIPGKRYSLQYGAPEVDDPGKDFIGFFEHYNFFAGDQRDQGVRGLLDELDEIRIDGERFVIEAGELNHGFPLSWPRSRDRYTAL